MVSVQKVRKVALALPESEEKDHHGRLSFRVATRIFATIWDEARLNVMLSEAAVLTTVQQRPDACAELWWGKSLRGVQVKLKRAEEALVRDLLADAWEQKAPKRLLEERISKSKSRSPHREAMSIPRDYSPRAPENSRQP